MYQIWDNLATCNLLESYTPEGWIIVDVRDLNDSAENEVEVVKRKIILIANLLGCGQKVVIRCMAGMSRSNTLACAALILFSLEHGWDHYWNQIQKKCPRARANQDFIEIVKKALMEIGVERRRLYDF